MVEPIQTTPIHSISSIRNYRYSQHLDFLRGIAALAVSISHVRTLFFTDYLQLVNPSIFLKACYFLTSLGHESVMIFFVLSGFFISSSVWKSIQKNQWSWRRYLLVNRLPRLYIVLVPALLLGCFWDFTGLSIFGSGETSLYGGKILENSGVTFNMIEKLNFSSFFGSIFFLQTILVSPIGSNRPLWSLANEFWYYILFPLILLIILSRKKLPLKKTILYLTLTLSIFLGISGDIRFYFLIWLMGYLIYLAPIHEIANNKLVLILGVFISTLILFVCFAISRFDVTSNQYLADFLIGIASSLLIYVLLNDRTPSQDSFYGRFSQGLAGFSYTLYLVHLPILSFLRACLIQDTRWQPDILHLCWGLLIVIFVIFYAYLISRFTEAKTDKLKWAIAAWLNRQPASQ